MPDCTVLILAPHRNDAAMASAILQDAEVRPVVVADAAELARRAADDFAAILVTEEACTPDLEDALRRVGTAAPAWSTPPVLALLTSPERPPAPLQRVLESGPPLSVLLLQRPLQRRQLHSAIETQLRFRRRQYAVRDLIRTVEQGEARQRMLLHELDHRVKNMLATLTGIVRFMARNATDVDGFALDLRRRIQGLSLIHERLGSGAAEPVPLDALVHDAVTPFAASSAQLSTDGPPVHLALTIASPLAMVLNELATNALKHGALSCEGGRVTVTWSRPAADAPRGVLALSWTERGGPPVSAAPPRRGFGSRVLEDMIASNLHASVSTDFAPDGLAYAVSIPVMQNGGIMVPDTWSPDRRP